MNVLSLADCSLESDPRKLEDIQNDINVCIYYKVYKKHTLYNIIIMVMVIVTS